MLKYYLLAAEQENSMYNLALYYQRLYYFLAAEKKYTDSIHNLRVYYDESLDRDLLKDFFFKTINDFVSYFYIIKI